MAGTAEEIGFSLVILSLVFACAALIRRWSRPLRQLFIPTAVIGGFLVPGLGLAIIGVLSGIVVGTTLVNYAIRSPSTDVVKGYSYRQIITRPILGGGFIAALAVPLIDLWGLPAFTIGAAAITAVFVGWGMRRVGQWSGAVGRSSSA